MQRTLNFNEVIQKEKSTWGNNELARHLNWVRCLIEFCQ